jgi:hypothetical protein
VTVPIDDRDRAGHTHDAGNSGNTDDGDRRNDSRAAAPDSGSESAAATDAPELRRWLQTLADDPDAPPTTVTAETVLTAARTEHGGQPQVAAPRETGRTGAADPTADRPGHGRPATRGPESRGPDSRGPESRGPDFRGPVSGGPAGRPGTARAAYRRRTGLIALVVAAAVAGIAAIVLPLTLGGVGSTTTASDSAGGSVVTGSAAGRSGAGQSSAAAAEAPTAGRLPATGSAAASGPAGVSAPAAAAGALPSDAAQGDAASPGAGSAEAASSCWPPLSPAAVTALTQTLPPGAFTTPVPLDGGCEQDPVAGAVLPGSVPGTELVVRVVRAEPGACARSAGEAASRCVAAGGDRYTATDASGGVTVYVYGGGREVAVGPLTSIDGVPSVPTGLTADQLDAAARAVLGATA